MSEQGIERFGWVLGADGEHGGIDRRPDGNFVRYADYKACEEAGRMAFERWGSACVRVIRRELEAKDQLDALRKGLRDEMERLRLESDEMRRAARDPSLGGDPDHTRHIGRLHASQADRLAALLDSSGGEK